MADATIKVGDCQAERSGAFEPAMNCERFAESPGGAPDEFRLVPTFDDDPHATRFPGRIRAVVLTRKL